MSILILFWHLFLSLPVGFFRSRFPIKACMPLSSTASVTTNISTDITISGNIMICRQDVRPGLDNLQGRELYSHRIQIVRPIHSIIQNAFWGASSPGMKRPVCVAGRLSPSTAELNCLCTCIFPPKHGQSVVINWELEQFHCWILKYIR